MIAIFLLILPVVSPDDVQLVIASVTATPSNAAGDPENLIDGDPSTMYHTIANNTDPAWIKLKLSNPANVSKVQIINRYDCNL